MSSISPVQPQDLAAAVPLFAALGDETRLRILSRLSGGRTESITSLSADSSLTRQAVTKHLNVLASAGLVSDERIGRERLWRYAPEPVADASEFLDKITRQWDEALGRLKDFVES
jgi:DNA-binding transcriptional ArsR family regulator